MDGVINQFCTVKNCTSTGCYIHVGVPLLEFPKYFLGSMQNCFISSKSSQVAAVSYGSIYNLFHEFYFQHPGLTQYFWEYLNIKTSTVSLLLSLLPRVIGRKALLIKVGDAGRRDQGTLPLGFCARVLPWEQQRLEVAVWRVRVRRHLRLSLTSCSPHIFFFWS